MINLLKNKWLRLSQSDRNIYALLLLLVILALLLTFIWLPSQQARQRLSTQIQEKKSQLVQMQAQAAQISVLQRAIQLSHSNPAGLKSAIETSAKLHGLQNRISNIESSSSVVDANGTKTNDVIKLTLASVSFDVWVSWVSALQSEHHIRVLSCQMTRLPDATGTVAVEANLVAE